MRCTVPNTAGATTAATIASSNSRATPTFHSNTASLPCLGVLKTVLDTPVRIKVK